MVNNIVLEERKRQGKYTFMRVKEPFFNSYLTFATQKNSPFADVFNKG